MTPMRRLAHLAPSAELSKGLYEVRFVELPWFSCSFLFQRGKNLSVQVMSDDDMIPSNTTENRFYGSVSCFTAQDLFYIDTDNISQAIIILWPNALKLYIFIEPCCLIFQTEGPGFKRRLFYKTALNLPSQCGRSCTRVSFHVISWFIYMTDALMHAVESLGCTAAEHHLRCEFVIWTHGLEFPYCPSHEHSLLTLSGTGPHTQANSTVKFSRMDPFFQSVISYVYKCLLFSEALLKKCSQGAANKISE